MLGSWIGNRAASGVGDERTHGPHLGPRRMAHPLTPVCHEMLSALCRGLGCHTVRLLHDLAQPRRSRDFGSCVNAAICGAQTPEFRRLAGSGVERPIGLEPTTFSLGNRRSRVASGEMNAS